MRTGHTTFIELSETIRSNKRNNCKTVALLPVGCTEQHGPFLPLETDTLIAEYAAHSLVDRLTPHKLRGHTYPALSYSPTQSNSGYCGTASVHEDSFRAYAKDVCRSILKSGFDGLVIVCAHGPAEPSLKEVAFQIVHRQFQEKALPVKPVVVVNLFGQIAEVEALFRQKVGRHADWREFLMLHPILGKSYFTNNKIKAMKLFSKRSKRNTESPSIPGIPLEYRSCNGVIGAAYPDADLPLEDQAGRLWDIHLNALIRYIDLELHVFFRSYSK
jgi:creatinine amidohydrolase/Fe(II)-dependent formamide hydrolase-like protein